MANSVDGFVPPVPIMPKLKSDPRMQKDSDPKKMPFDGKRLFWGGFEPFVWI